VQVARAADAVRSGLPPLRREGQADTRHRTHHFVWSIFVAIDPQQLHR